MNTATAPSLTKPMPAQRDSSRRAYADLLVYLVLALLLGAAWKLTRMGYAPPGSDTGYWIGIVGGVMMLLLFSYPLRKHLRFMHRFGEAKWWLALHMVLGIGGPLLILVHSHFSVGSINGAVSLYSMLIVAGSGVVGRFLYLRVNRGLHGERGTLRELQSRTGLSPSDLQSKLRFAPAAEARLRAFEQRELQAQPGWATHLRQIFLLPWQQGWTYRRCAAEVNARLRVLAREHCWNAQERARRERNYRTLLQRYTASVTRIAQFAAYERVFALWHVAHVPFVYVFVFSAIMHIVAVHAY